ncbi:MAG: DEAD/DEAH box helicase family protein [Candidatus Pacebacteria bacterium]|nr:DEAD/DEAH box helicase family protein [Candidatus Paceibacterota bacterium]
MFALKPFQETAISQLKEKFLTLWKLGDRNLNLTFKSPTGSGKTIMMAQFLRDIVSDPRFQNADVGFLWITNSDSLAMQSKDKLFSYYGGASENTLLDLNDLRDGCIPRSGVFFINWQKLVSRAQTNRKLRTEGELNTTFDEYLEATHSQGREVVLIIDEEHIASSTVLASDLIQNVIKPRIIIGVSATPQTVGVTVDVNRADVVREGLIKEKIIFQTEEDLAKKEFAGMDQDDILLTLAYNKRAELVAYYKEIGVEVNPLVLVQLPNDDKASKESGGVTKQALITDFLKSKGVFEHEIAVWLSEDKINLEDIERNNSPVSFLLFKQAAATGWDCPRASVLVMFREIKNPTFAIQTVGRILRMPLGFHFPKPELNLGYLYTNYKRNEVITGYSKSTEQNRPAIYGSYRKQSVKPIMVDSVFMSRTDYNDLGDSFQDVFQKVADKYFGINEKETKVLKRLKDKGLDISVTVTNGLIVNVEIDDYDNFTKELLAEGGSHDQEMSQYDLERLYNLFCFNLIAKQTDENKKFAPERSWGKLKTALNVWLLNNTGETRHVIYNIIVNDLLNQASVLAPVIGDALAVYRPIREQEVNRKSERAKRTEQIEIPRESLFYTDQYEEMSVKKSAMAPFYIERDYKGEDNEKEFIKFLEEHKAIEWWYKNGDSGSEYFSLAYYNPDENKEKLFYPDWIFKTKDKVWIVDTKKGSTAEIADTKYKAEALQEWLKGKKNIAGGIAVQDGPNGWKLNSGKKYTYSPSLNGWDNLKDVI